MKINHNPYTTSFNGKCLIKGSYTEQLKKAFFENKTLQNLANGDYDIIGTVRTRVILSKREAFAEGRDVGDILYKFTLTAKKSDQNIFEKIANLFSGKKQPSIKAYRTPCSEESMCNFIKGLTNEAEIRSRLNI